MQTTECKGLKIEIKELPSGALMATSPDLPALNVYANDRADLDLKLPKLIDYVRDCLKTELSN